MKLLNALFRSPTARPALVASAALLVSATLQAATPAAPAFKADIARGQQLAAACMACHTADGTRGAPANPILQGLAAGLSEEDMKHIAAFYASKPAPKGFAGN